MSRILISDGLSCDVLVMPGRIVDEFLLAANELQLKIYLYLMRNQRVENITVSSVADYFNYTEQDVLRAIKFWEKRGVLKNETGDNEESVSGNEVKKSSPASNLAPVRQQTKAGNVVTFSSRPSYTKEQLEAFSKRPEIVQLLFVAQQYLGKMLKSDDIASFLYMHEEMKFDAELIEYLIEYCVSNDKKNIRAIESIASEWHEAGVDSVALAKRRTMTVPKEVYEVFAAFGIQPDRQPIETEVAYVRRWTECYGYGMDIIGEACKRTVLSINKPSFRYANKIIKGWHDADVKGLGDIVRVDEEHQIKVAKEAAAGSKSTKGGRNSKVAKSDVSGFKNFSQREYDFDSLEKDILSN